MGYTVPNEGDKVEIPHDLCRPLRILGDLHFEEEESPGNVELDQSPSISNTFSGELSAKAEAQLRQYIEEHPRLTEEKEAELSEELDRLNSDISTQSDASSSTGDNISDGPAGKVNIDPDEFFGNHSTLTSEIVEIIQDKKPINVGEDVPEEVKEALGHIDPDEYHESLTEVSGFKQSLREFDAHPLEVSSIEPEDSLLSYHIGRVDYQHKGQWSIRITDGRRNDDAPDLQFSFTIISKSEPALFKHEIRINDGQFIHWSVSAGDEDTTKGIVNSDAVNGAEFHRTLHDRSWIMQFVEEFVGELENAIINSPVEWKEFD